MYVEHEGAFNRNWDETSPRVVKFEKAGLEKYYSRRASDDRHRGWAAMAPICTILIRDGNTGENKWLRLRFS